MGSTPDGTQNLQAEIEGGRKCRAIMKARRLPRTRMVKEMMKKTTLDLENSTTASCRNP